MLLGIPFLGERLTAAQAGGMALIGPDLVAIDGRAWARMQPPRGGATFDTEATVPAIQPD